METFYVLALSKWCTARYYNDRGTIRLVIDSTAYVRRKKKRGSGNDSQRLCAQTEKLREKSQRRKRSRIYAKILISPLIIRAPRKDLTNMSQVPLMTSDRNTPVECHRNMVILEVGLPGDSWTYCIERERLARRSEWFRAMLTGPLAPPVHRQMDSPPLLQLQHVDKRAFDHFLKHLHDEPVNFMSVSTARATLDVAHQYLCSKLARLATKYLETNLNSSTVLEIYRGLRLYANNQISNFDRSPNSPTAPSLPRSEADEIDAACTDLLLKCLTVIDSNPATVLRQERFEELSTREVAELARRDTLNLSSECILFSALDRWAAAECRRQGIEPLPINKRAVLSDEICFSVRYLLMNDREFVSGPMASGILTNEECVHIVSRILRHPERSQNNNLQGTSTIHPSMLSDTPRIGSYTCEDADCLFKPGKKERQDNRKNRRKECTSQGQRTCARIGNCLIQILSCVFD